MFTLTGHVLDHPLDDIGEWDDLVRDLLAVLHGVKLAHNENQIVEILLASDKPRDTWFAGEGFLIDIKRIT